MIDWTQRTRPSVVIGGALIVAMGLVTISINLGATTEQASETPLATSTPQTVANIPESTPLLPVIPPPVRQEKGLVDVVKEWQDRIAYLECGFQDNHGNLVLASSGSGFLVTDDNSTYVLTNKHVVVADGKYVATMCEIQFLENDKIIYVTKDDIGAMPNYDMAILWIDNSDSYVANFQKTLPKLCEKPSLGERVAILGYPVTGSSESITVTDGIISGYEGAYFVTNAKMEHGNSGGAAILVNDNCYLGIPSAVVVGETESLGRILDFNAAIVGALMQQ